MSLSRQKILLSAAESAPAVLLVLVFVTFAATAPHFLESRNLANILVQSASTAIVATGMTFVLLTAGVDLSVGAIMFVSAALAGKLALAGWPLPLALGAIGALGVACGAVNAYFITRFSLLPFIVTLATLYLGRGFALWLTETRAMNLPDSFLALGTARIGPVPVPLVILGLAVSIAHWILNGTPFGRQIYAVGSNPAMARKAGLNPRLILFRVYLLSGFCAAIGGIVSLSQLGAVSPTFGHQKEFAAIAAAVLGGTSLFGGRGQVFPGTLVGTLLIQTVENGLVMVNADPYLYPLVTSGIIFLAVLVDSCRVRWTARLTKRSIAAGGGGHT
ncbi:MAG: ABC transporter permease [Verrucomicrobiota bacterium]